MGYKLSRLDGVDAFNLLCGKRLGQGIHREVFECRIREDLVVKLEYTETGYRYFANVFEDKFWSDNQHASKIAKWLAPIEFLSPDGRILLQKKCQPVTEAELPEELPSWMTDIKAENFGRLDGNIVLCDYVSTITNISSRMRKWK